MILPPRGALVPARTKRGRVLLVDDEESLARLFSRLLEAAGYEVSTRADGQAAVELLASTAFDVIVSDIDMPRMNGIRLLEAIRQHDLDVPVILMTGAPALETAVQAVKHGALLYLTKPVDADELEKAIGRAVRLKQVAELKQAALVLLNQGGLGLADRLALETSFERALDTMWLAYQPIVRASDRSLFGYEALMRTEEPALPHPGAILDAAERLGRLDHVGQRVRDAAARRVTEAAAGSVLFVNLHANDLLDDTLYSAKSPLSAFADRVVLEITERASLDVVHDAQTKVRELRSMGFRIAIDDLGAGYAGLTSFATLEPEVVKLDMSLVRDVDKNPRQAKLIAAMISLCKELGMMVVAEGVETSQERDLLVDFGCDLLQGYLLAKPARPFPEFVWEALG